MTTDPTLDTDEAASAPTQKTFWNLTTCCGCLAVVFILGLIGLAIGVNWVLNQFLPKEPYEFDPITYTNEEATAARTQLGKLRSGEEVVFTPRELSILLQNAFDEEGNEMKNGKFSIAPTEDGQMRFQMSLELPEGFFKGRWVSVDLTASGQVKDRQPVDFRMVGVRLWDVPSILQRGRVRRDLEKHEGPVPSVSRAPRGLRSDPQPAHQGRRGRGPALPARGRRASARFGGAGGRRRAQVVPDGADQISQGGRR